MIKRRSVITTLLLCMITCGLYYLWLIYSISQEMNELTNTNQNNAALDLLLTIITCGFYPIYWFYKISRQIEDCEYDLGMRTSSIALLNVLLSVVQLGIIAMLIVVSEMNRCIDERIVA